jgi:hypothetical protein
MLPAAYAVPVAAVLVVSGAVACFAGYRLFRIVLGVYGFILGAMVTSSVMGTANTGALVLAAVVGGVVGSALMVAAYFVGVGLVGAGLASLAVNMVWRVIGGDPPTWLLVGMAVLGALGALKVQRYVVVIGTALAGSWTLIVGGLALAGGRFGGMTVTGDNIWVVYGAGPLPTSWWITGAWVGLALLGGVVQTSTTTRTGKQKRPAGKRK